MIKIFIEVQFVKDTRFVIILRKVRYSGMAKNWVRKPEEEQVFGIKFPGPNLETRAKIGSLMLIATPTVC